MKVSAVIITLNEERNIGRCLNSLKGIVDEMIVVDSGSIDSTVEIASSFNALIIPTSWEGYAANKNLGNLKASGDYILSIDADECLSPELAEWLKGAKNTLSGIYRMSRLTNYCGQWIRHCGWYPDWKLRLFPKEQAKWVGDYVHETLEHEEGLEVIDAKGDLLHYSINSLEEHIQRINKYSSLAALELKAKNKPYSWAKALIGPAFRFLKMYIFRQGIREGYLGFQISKISAYSIFLRYAKLKELYVREKNSAR